MLCAPLPLAIFVLILSSPVQAQSVAPAADQAVPADGQDDGAIVVTGTYARSLAAATETKRKAAYGVDSIASTDIGKFPPQNVAEALQLITGVAITRPRSEGLYVSVRGLGPQFQSTLVNGRTVAINDLIGNGGAAGRQFRFEMLPAEFVSQIDVVKMPTADMTEGALGGNIDVKTFHPLDVGNKTTVNLRGTYTSMTDKVRPNSEHLRVSPSIAVQVVGGVQMDSRSFLSATEHCFNVMIWQFELQECGIMKSNVHNLAVENLIGHLDATGQHAVNEYCTRTIAEKLVKPGDIVLDLGANEGFHTFHLSSLVGYSGRVHAFEPNPSHWRRLLGHDNIRLWPMAVGDDISVQNFYLPIEDNLHQVGSLVDPRDFLGHVPMRVLTVPQVTIDSIDELSGKSVRFIKMDIERREYNCILGMREFISNSKAVIILENLTPEINDVLVDLNYQIHSMIYGCDINILPNVLAIPESDSDDLSRIALSQHEVREIVELYGKS